MKELSANFHGNATLFVLVKNMTADKILKEIKDAGGIVLKTSLDEVKEKNPPRRPRASAAAAPAGTAAPPPA
jgi:uncharacterized membrane protein